MAIRRRTIGGFIEEIRISAALIVLVLLLFDLLRVCDRSFSLCKIKLLQCGRNHCVPRRLIEGCLGVFGRDGDLRRAEHSRIVHRHRIVHHGIGYALQAAVRKGERHRLRRADIGDRDLFGSIDPVGVGKRLVLRGHCIQNDRDADLIHRNVPVVLAFGNHAPRPALLAVRRIVPIIHILLFCADRSPVSALLVKHIFGYVHLELVRIVLRFHGHGKDVRQPVRADRRRPLLRRDVRLCGRRRPSVIAALSFVTADEHKQHTRGKRRCRHSQQLFHTVLLSLQRGL